MTNEQYPSPWRMTQYGNRRMNRPCRSRFRSNSRDTRDRRQTFPHSTHPDNTFHHGIPSIISGAINLGENIIGQSLCRSGFCSVIPDFHGIPMMRIDHTDKRNLAHVIVVVSGTESVTVDIRSNTLGRIHDGIRKMIRTLLQCGRWFTGEPLD